MIELDKAYEAKKFEDKIYKTWEESGFFNPDNLKNAKNPYCILMPPPNVTGILHLGHALENSLLDTEIRYRRMCGYKALLIPGADHAAVATQARVEKELQKNGIKNPREELGREKLLEEIKKYAENSKSTILNQIRKMGTSCDWSRFAYTFDEKRSLAVNTLFKKMYDDGLIYRGSRLINWDPKLQTTISDDEIIWEEENVPLYYLQYGPFTIATARPETKFGDKYVVMHPDDERYAKYNHGDTFEAEWINGKVKATVIKDEIIDRNFGTGVMTITPWHDATDFDLSQKHKLEMEQIIDMNGNLMPIAGEFSGMNIIEAREKIVEKLKQKGLLVKTEENYIHKIAKGDRSGAIIEPQISKQWFVDVNKIIPGKNKSLKQLMKDVFTIGHNGNKKKIIKITPDRFVNSYMQWIDNLRDWCISRQIWWGHRIPVWYNNDNDEIIVPKTITELHVTRHGITDWNKDGIIQGTTDTPLDEDNICKIESLIPKLKNEHFDIIISSPLKRARQTAQIINNKLNIPIEINKILIERDYAGFEGKSKKEVHKEYPEYEKDKMNFDIPGNEETYDELKKRAEEFIEYINKKHAGKKILIISHHAFLRALNMLINDLDAKTASQYSLPFGQIDKYQIFDGNYKLKNWIQDPDTLDTWFSSGSWTFSCLGWPNKTKDLKTYHPTSWMQMGYEILFFWMARMILMSCYALDDIPFKNVYIHGILRAKDGRKFSKSLGNGLDPIEIIEKYGTDALRLSLLKGITPGNDAKFYEEKVLGSRNFINKLWNISRYILMSSENIKYSEKIKPISLSDYWILSKFKNVIESVIKNLENHNFSNACDELYEFTWTDFADWYLEISKIENGKKQILIYILENLLKLWHPFIPFVTETIWSNLGKEKLLMIENWPKLKIKTNKKSEYEFEKIKEIIITIRTLKNDNKIDLKTIVNCHLESEKYNKLINEQKNIVENLAKVKLTEEKYKDTIHISDIDIFIEITVDEKSKEKQILELEKYIKSLETKLSNNEFISNAPANIIESEKKKLQEAKELLKKLK